MIYALRNEVTVQMKETTINSVEETTADTPVVTTEEPKASVSDNTQTQTEKASDSETPEETKAEKTFTQAEVDKFIQERLTRVYAKAGAKNASEFEQILTAKDNDLTDARTQLKELQKSNALRDNNISLERYDDIDTWFKGKGKEFTAEELTEAVKSHPEWVDRKVTAPQIGGNIESVNVNKGKNEADEIARLLGYDKLV